MRVDEGRKGCSLLTIKMKVHTVVGSGEKSVLNDPGFDLRLGNKEKENCKDNRGDERKKNVSRSPTPCMMCIHQLPTANYDSP